MQQHCEEELSYSEIPRLRVLKLRYFEFRGEAQFVYLARPEGPGPRFI
jgi:hypothetical protein